MTPNFKIFLVVYDQLHREIMKDLTEEEKKSLVCYSVQPSVLKMITTKIPIINEWQLPRYDQRYQTLKYYEYGTFPHLLNNDYLIKDLTHVGIMHYDVAFPKDSINDIYKSFEENPNKICYVTKRKIKDSSYFTIDQFTEICNYLNKNLELDININEAWEGDWISEALSVVPIEVYRKFGEFILKNQYDIENILNTNRWGIMNYVKHRICGFIERLWGIYLVYLVHEGYQLEQLSIVHEHGKYNHAHLVDKQNFLNNFKS